MSEDRQVIGQSRNGHTVSFDPLHSHIATHFNDTPELKSLVAEAIAQTDLSGDSMLFDTDMGRIVGKSDLVENDPGDMIVYAKRLNRDVYTSFNTSKTAQPCSTIALSLQRLQDGTYDLQSGWIGSIDCPPFPGEPDETPESKPFWMSHSLVWGRQAVQPGTETAECPWQ